MTASDTVPPADRARVTVTVVAWNSMHVLPDALASLAAQTFRAFSLVIIDNASTDGVAEHVREHYPDAALIRNARNRGFAHAHNQGIDYARAYHRADGDEHYVFAMNPDTMLDPDCLERLVAAMDANHSAGSAGPLLLRMTREGDGVLAEGVRTRVIDSAGLRVSKARRVSDLGAGETLREDDEDPYLVKREVFGISAALVLYRLSALEDVAYHGEYFDPDFFVYKEDVDLAWRLRLRGWSALAVPSARAYHYRGAGADDKAGIWRTFRLWRTKPDVVNYHSYKNHLLMLVKDEHVANAFLHAWRIVPYEAAKALFLLIFSPRTLGALGEAIAKAPRAWRKRRLNLSRARATAKEMRQWFG